VRILRTQQIVRQRLESRGVRVLGSVDTLLNALFVAALSMPAGFPKCGTPSDCLTFTNNKVIAAHSFVSFAAVGSDPGNLAADSRPDDLSPRDRLGHGTTVASCAARESVTGLVTFNGIAPAAWLGNYKVFGSPGLNENAPDQAVIAAVEQAVKDGREIINLSLRGVAAVADPTAACWPE
jgi:hypothetical protein